MENKLPPPANTDEDIARQPASVQAILNKIRAVIKETAPQAQEKISYQMPAFFQNGPLVYFGASKNHIGFYPTGEGIAAFKDEIGAYKSSKGAIQFPLDQPIPYDLIRKIVLHRLAANQQK